MSVWSELGLEVVEMPFDQEQAVTDARFCAAARSDVPRLCALVRTLGEALPPPEKLYLLAEWLDLKFGDTEEGDEVQQDLRAWARAIIGASLVYRTAIGDET